MSQRVDLERCAEFRDRLDAWIDGDLDETQAAAMRAHVDGCESCRRERQLAEEVVAELRAMPEFELPERVKEAVGWRTRPGTGCAACPTRPRRQTRARAPHAIRRAASRGSAQPTPGTGPRAPGRSVRRQCARQPGVRAGPRHCRRCTRSGSWPWPRSARPVAAAARRRPAPCTRGATTQS